MNRPEAEHDLDPDLDMDMDLGLGLRFCLIDLAGLRGHEEVDGAALRELAAEIVRDGQLRQPVVVDAESLVILDGHHRVSALRGLGCRLVPAYLVDYGDPRITVEGWRADAPQVTKEDVVRAGRLGRPYPPKTSRHRFGATPAQELAARPVPLELLGGGGSGPAGVGAGAGDVGLGLSAVGRR